MPKQILSIQIMIIIVLLAVTGHSAEASTLPIPPNLTLIKSIVDAANLNANVTQPITPPQQEPVPVPLPGPIKLSDLFKPCPQGKCFNPCTLMKKCKDGYTCKNGACIKNQCKIDSECPKNSICVNGKCQDKCNLLDCRNGCQNGQCLPIPCSSNTNCLLGQACQSGACVQKCALTTCITGNECIHGECVPIKCKTDQSCPVTHGCVNGTCMEKCQGAGCRLWEVCTHGQCVGEVRKCKGTEGCGIGEKCAKGVCVPKCTGVSCGKGQVCVQGVCQSQNCPSQKCPKGTYCNKNTCMPDTLPCTDTPATIKVCTDPRPTFQNCPLPPYAPPGPAPSYCGITATGERWNFRYPECLVCMNPQIVYYYDQACYDAPFECQAAETCEGYYCSAPGCQADSECPYDWQACISGKCVDRCTTMLCPTSGCKFGSCSWKPNPLGECDWADFFSGSGSCPEQSQTCYGRLCVEECTRHACPAGEKCQPGPNCVPE